MVLHRYVLALEVAGFVEALAERGGKGRIRCSGIGESDDRRRWLLRPRRERPRCRRAAEQRDERAPLHSITSSARNRNDSGIVSLSALAVVKLITRSNFLGCSTGMSPGFAPRRILST